MTASEIIQEMNKMEVDQKLDFFSYLSKNHFNTLSPEARRILSDYDDGLLIRMDDEDEY